MFIVGTVAGLGRKSWLSSIQEEEMEQICSMDAANTAFDSPLSGFLHI